MDAFTNSAGNTKSWAYYSPDKNLTYEASAQLESYFWYCFKKAFQHIGVNVLDSQYAGPRPYHYGYWGWEFHHRPSRRDSGRNGVSVCIGLRSQIRNVISSIASLKMAKADSRKILRSP